MWSLPRLACVAGFVSSLASAVCVSPVRAWGPVSHYLFACTQAVDLAPLQDKPVLETLYVGADLPDGMWNGVFLTGTQCSPLANHMHSPLVGGYMVRTAMNATYASDPYFLSLAYGFVSHPVADAVGFATAGGFLGNMSSVINWELEWPCMLAVDSYLLQTNAFPATCDLAQTMPKVSLEQKGIDFLAAVNAEFVQMNPTFPALNATQIQACSDPWGPQVNEMNQWAAKMTPAATAQQLIFFDRFGATTIGDVSRHLAASIACVNLALTYFFDHITDLTLTVEDVWTETNAYINDLYANGQCVASQHQQPEKSKHHSALNKIHLTE